MLEFDHAIVKSRSGLACTEKGVDVKPFAIWTIPEVPLLLLQQLVMRTVACVKSLGSS